MTHFFKNLTQRKYPLFVVLGCFLFAIPLLGYAYNGSFMRYHGDDYCYAASLAKYGFWKAQTYSFLHPMPYHGNRFSLTFFSNLSDLFGPYANAFLPLIVILFWVVGCALLFASVAKIAHHAVYRIEALWLGEVFVFLTLYQAPHLVQSLYWRSGMLPYTAFLGFTTFLLALILRKGLLQESSYWVMGVAFAAALVAAGFSETGAALQAGCLLIIAGYLVYGFFTRRKWKANLTRLIVAALAGTFVAVLLLALSPSIQRMLDEPFTINRLISSVKESTLASWAFITQSVEGLPIPNLVTFLTFYFISFFISLRDPKKDMAYRSLFFTRPLLAILSCFTLITLCMLPTELARTNYPDPRVLITARAVLVATVAGCGYLLGRGTAYLYQPLPRWRYLQVLFIVTLALLSIYPLYATRSIMSRTPSYHNWANLWDQRHREIQAAQQNGVLDVSVVRLHSVITGVSDLSPDSGHWFNACAATYYGLNSIKADQSSGDE
jgi:hypothetical protein